MTQVFVLTTATTNKIRQLSDIIKKESELQLLDGGSDDTASKPCALVFFGLVKNLNESHVKNFEENLLLPLLERCASVKVYLHTYNISVFNNPRSENNEANVTIDSRSSIDLLFRHLLSYRVISLWNVSFSSPEDADDSMGPIDYYLQRGDPWPDNPNISMKYYLRQLYSLQLVTDLWAREKHGFSLVLYTRPDLYYESKLELPATIKRNTLYSPHFAYPAMFNDRIGFYSGYNDRMAIGKADVMEIYGRRLKFIDLMFTSAPPYQNLHAEMGDGFSRNQREKNLMFSFQPHSL